MTGRKFAAEDAAPKLARERRMQPPVEVTLQKTRILRPAMIVQARPPCAVTLLPGHLPRRAVASGAGTGRLSCRRIYCITYWAVMPAGRTARRLSGPHPNEARAEAGDEFVLRHAARDRGGGQIVIGRPHIAPGQPSSDNGRVGKKRVGPVR